MAYQVQRADRRIVIRQDGRVAFELEREDAGLGYRALFPVYDGKRGAKITTDQYSNDLIERVRADRILAGCATRVPGGYVVPVPFGAGDFFVNETGYLCCRTPVRIVLTKDPVDGLGIKNRGQIRPATLLEREAAGHDVLDGSQSGVFLEAEA